MSSQEGNFRLFSIYSDNMVLQRGVCPSFAGPASDIPDGTPVFAEFMGCRGEGKVEGGRWLVALPCSFSACGELGNSVVITCGEHVVTLRDVLVGDIWLVGGQSNATLRFTGSCKGSAAKMYALNAAVLDSADRGQNIRLFSQKEPDIASRSDCGKELDDALPNLGWTYADREELLTRGRSFSILGYLFARDLYEKNPDVPIGAVMVAFGGAALALLAPKEACDAFPDDLKDRHIKDIFGVSLHPSWLYNAMTAPFERLSATGMIFFQGESDARFDGDYDLALAEYICALRRRFKNPELLFLNVQLTTYGPTVLLEDGTLLDIDGGDFAACNNLRMAQTRVKTDMKLKNYELVATYDTGWVNGEDDGAHCVRKGPISERLADIAAALRYGISDMEHAACPVPSFAEPSPAGAVVHMLYCGDGLRTKTGSGLDGFEVLKDGSWRSAHASAEGSDVEVRCDFVPEAVRYAHKLRVMNDVVCNLVSSGGKPAVAFTMSLRK